MTIPQDIRQKLGLLPHSEVEFDIVGAPVEASGNSAIELRLELRNGEIRILKAASALEASGRTIATFPADQNTACPAFPLTGYSNRRARFAIARNARHLESVSRRPRPR